MNYEKMWEALRLKFGNRFVPKHTDDVSEAKDIGNISLSEIMALFENGDIAEYEIVSTASKPSLYQDDLNEILVDKMFVSEDSAYNYIKKMWNMQYPQSPYDDITGISLEKKREARGS